MAAKKPKSGYLTTAGYAGFSSGPPAKATPAEIAAAQRPHGMGGNLAKFAPPGVAPVAAAMSGGTPPPVDPIYASQVGNNNQTGGDNDLGYIQQRNAGLSNLGYTGTYDPADPFSLASGSSLTYDPSNPFSQATLLRTHFEAAKRGDTNNLAARGQLYSGALGNQLGIDQSGFNQSDDALLKQAQGLVAGAIQSHRTNMNTYGPQGSANLDAQAASVGRQKPGDTPDAPPNLIAPGIGGALTGPKKTLVRAKPLGKPKAVGFGKKF